METQCCEDVTFGFYHDARVPVRYATPVLSAHLVQDGLVDASRYNGSDVEQTRLRIQERSGLLDPE
eukprot:6065880-Amphidinium_carterae.1